MTTPAALVPALPAAPATSSIEAAATLAMAATSSRRAIRPEGMGCALANVAAPGNALPQACLWPSFRAGMRPMLGMEFIKANRETVERAIRDKGVELDLDALLALEGEVRGLKTKIEGLR